MSYHTLPYSAPGEPQLILRTPLVALTPKGPVPTPSFSNKNERLSPETVKLIAMIAALFIEETFDCRGKLPPLPEASQIKSAKRTDSTVSTLQLDQFIAHVLSRTRVDQWKVFAALYILDSIKKKFPRHPGSYGHRLFVVALMAASKLIDDEPYSNESWAAETGDLFSVHELNSMERDIYMMLDHKLHMEFEKLSGFKTRVRLAYESLAEAQLEAAATGAFPVERKPTAPYLPSLAVSRDFNATLSSAVVPVGDPHTRRPAIYAPAPTASTIASGVSLGQPYPLPVSESFRYTSPSDSIPMKVRRKTPPAIYAPPTRSFTMPECTSIAASNQPPVVVPPTRSLTMPPTNETERHMRDERSSATLAQHFPASRPLPTRPPVSTSGQSCVPASNAPCARVMPSVW